MGSIDKLAGAPSLPLTSPMTLTQEATSLRGSQLLRASVKISDTWMVAPGLVPGQGGPQHTRASCPQQGQCQTGREFVVGRWGREREIERE